MQYNKVEICGVNTSKLKVLSEKEKLALLTKMREGTPAEAAKAREELINGNLRLVDIAYAVGFEDQSYFTKVFKKLTGVAPCKFKESKGRQKHSTGKNKR